MKRPALALAPAVVLAFSASHLFAAGQVLLKNAFIAAYRNRVTITIDFKVDDVHPQPNAIGNSSDDGDLHMAGRSTDVGLPMVAELSNGRLAAVKAVETAIHQADGTGHAVQISGVWRLWMEHKSAEAMQQGDAVPVPANTNPKHVFEVHPVTAFSGTAVLETFAPVHDDAAPSKQYHPTDAPTAFARYESEALNVSQGPVFTSIDGPQIPYNYTEFVVEIAGPVKEVDDGAFVLGKIYDLESNLLVADPKRMVLVKDSTPATRLGAAAVGARFHVLGIPRINLDLLMRTAVANPGKPIKSAYEMIVMAVM